MSGLEDYRRPLTEEEIRGFKPLIRGKPPMKCSYAGLCAQQAKYLHPQGLPLCLADGAAIKIFGCNCARSS